MYACISATKSLGGFLRETATRVAITECIHLAASLPDTYLVPNRGIVYATVRCLPWIRRPIHLNDITYKHITGKQIGEIFSYVNLTLMKPKHFKQTSIEPLLGTWIDISRSLALLLFPFQVFRTRRSRFSNLEFLINTPSYYIFLLESRLRFEQGYYSAIKYFNCSEFHTAVWSNRIGNEANSWNSFS